VVALCSLLISLSHYCPPFLTTALLFRSPPLPTTRQKMPRRVTSALSTQRAVHHSRALTVHTLTRSCTRALVHSYTHTLMHSCTHTLIHSYSYTLHAYGSNSSSSRRRSSK
jgi:hypothetical protein